MLFLIIKSKYRRGEITAVQVWEYVDEGKITAAQAVLICGPRPSE